MRKLLRHKCAENFENRIAWEEGCSWLSVGRVVSVHPGHGSLQLTVERGEHVGFPGIWLYNPPKL